MSTEEKNSTARYSTILNNVRRQAQQIRDANEKLRDLRDQLKISERPAPAEILDEATTVIGVALVHIRDVFKDF